MAELEARIVDLEGAMQDLEDNADQWAAWWDARIPSIATPARAHRRQDAQVPATYAAAPTYA